MKGIFVFLATWIVGFSAYAQCDVETSLPDLGETGDSLEYSTDLMPADWRFEGPDGVRIFEGSPINVSFSQPGTYTGLLAGQNSCEETIRIEFQVRIFDLMGTPEIQINGGAEFTNEFDVTVDLMTTGAVEYLISDNSNCRTGEWKPMAASAPWELPFENEEGRVFAKFRTPIEESACISDSIVHDDTLPIVNLVTAPAALTNELNARFVFDAQDTGSGVDTMLCGLSGPALDPCDLESNFLVSEGLNTLVFQARDLAGNLGAVMLYEWRVDITKPTVEITSQPEALTNQVSAQFEFSGTDEATEIVGYTCQLDAAVVSCDSPQEYNNLSDGPHRFAVIAQDAAGNKSDPAIYEWVVDSRAPVVVFTSVPENPSSDLNVQVEFTASDAGTGVREIRCQLDSDPIFTCQSPLDLTNLGVGTHQIQVFAFDEVGNTSEPISYTWETVVEPPVLVFTSTPEKETAETTANFTFLATSQVSVKGYECAINQAAFADCESPLELLALGDGAQALTVRATDELGQLSNSVTYNWFVDSLAPVVAFTSVPDAVIEVTEASVSFSAVDSGVGVESIYCQLDDQDYEACTSPVELADLSEGNHTFRVYAEDSLGNRSETIQTNFEVSLTLPVVAFVSVPPLETGLTEAEFQFVAESSLGIDRIECDIDGLGFSLCTSPAVVQNLNVGAHVFSVVAYDSLGRPSDTISYTWNVIKVPDVIEEEFIAKGGSQKIDLLFVVDNSGSMYKELTRREVRRNFRNILGELKGLDWRLGLITTDARGSRPGEAGRLAKFRYGGDKVLTPNSRKPERNLIETISRLSDGSNYEQGIWALQQSLGRSENDVFFRDDAVLVAIIVSDEDEAGRGASSKPQNQPEVLIQKISDRWGEDKLAQFHAVIWRDGDKGCSRTAQRKGRVYNRLVDMTGGKTHSICKSRYIKGLNGYADIAKSGDTVRELQCEPVDGLVEIAYSPEPSTRPKTELNGSRLSFSPAPEKGTVVSLRYSCAKSLSELARN